MSVKNKEKSRMSEGKKKQLANLEKGKFKKGESGNLDGRPLGQRNYLTIYREALTQLAKAKNMTPYQLEDLIHKTGLNKALKGDYKFYQDVMDRIHNKPVQKQEITGKDGKALIPDNLSKTNADVLINQFLKTNASNRKNSKGRKS